MKEHFLVTADLHFDNYKSLVPAEVGSISTRCEDVGKVLGSMREYAIEHNIHNVIVLGDIFHWQNKIEVPVFNYAVKQVSKFATHDIDVYLLAGNHDQTTKSGVTNSLESLGRERVHIIDTPTTLFVGSYNWVLVPFLPTQEYSSTILSLLEGLKLQHTNKPVILFTHVGLDGSHLNNQTIGQEKTTVSDIHTDKFVAGFLGHYHKPQKVNKNTWYVGAPLQHNFNDIEQERGFWDVACTYSSGSYTAVPSLIPLDNLPKFHYIKVEDFEDTNIPEQDFVKLIGATQEELRKFADSLQVVGAKEMKSSEAVQRVSMSLGETWGSLIDKYVDYVGKNLTPKERQKYKKIGLKLFTESGEEE